LSERDQQPDSLIPIPEAVQAQMRAEWNERAREDAYYYVAFGRREQEDEEFSASAREVLNTLEHEMKRGLPGKARALEIGCGPGRLLQPMSRHFEEVQGVDVSDEMISLARQRLSSIPWAHVQTGNGKDLSMFADESFDFVWSYAVFQHIPEEAVVLSYLVEAARVMKPGAILRCQLNGLPREGDAYTTWSGARFTHDEVRKMALALNVELLALEGVDTQYMWTTWRKRAVESPIFSPLRATIRRITNSFSTEPMAPATGRFAAISLWVEGLDVAADLNHLTLYVGGKPARLTYLGRREDDGIQQLSAVLPRELSTGLHAVELFLEGREAADPRNFRIIPSPPLVPRVVSLTDGVDLLAGTTVRSGHCKAVLEECMEPSFVFVEANGFEITDKDFFLVDPQPPRHEMNFRLPAGLSNGPCTIEMRYGSRYLGRFSLTLDRA
jgi:ubiquinone/menaquinone biosynthesis C-methylase UbiE